MRSPLFTGVLAGVFLLTPAHAASPPEARQTLWYDRPAQCGEEARPVGNGRNGAMIHGGVHREHIQLNEESIWSGAPSPKVADPT